MCLPNRGGRLLRGVPTSVPQAQDVDRPNVDAAVPIRHSRLRATVPRVSEHERDTGLVRAVGPWGLTASIVNIVVGAGIFAVPGALAACIGPYAPLAFLVCAVAIGSVAICFAEGGSRIPTSGGAYGYIDAAFGSLAGYVAGTLLWFGNVLACGGVAAALADAAVSALPPRFTAPVHAAVIIGV